MPIVTLSTIICEVPQETDKDEIFLKIKGKKVWPLKERFFKIDVDEIASINFKFRLNGTGWLKVELWEYDITSKNDFLGTFHLKIENTPGQFSDMLVPNEEYKDVSYFLNWEIS